MGVNMLSILVQVMEMQPWFTNKIVNSANPKTMEHITDNNGTLLHIIHRKADMTAKRTDIVGPDEFIQVAALKMQEGDTFKPHKHKWKESYEPHSCIAQESWVVIQGVVLVTYYDTRGQWVKNAILWPGDISITLLGGHNYEGYAPDTLVYEFKTGPYTGQEDDKEFI